MSKSKPHIIEFPKIGESSIGYISVGEVQDQIPFDVKRVFWTYYTPESIVRGRHAHYETEMVLIALNGRITVLTEMPGEEVETFILDAPNQGVFLPKLCWHTMQYSHSAVQIVLASTLFNPKDYIRDYKDFEQLSK